MSLYQPNLPILPDWKGTLTVAFAQLRRAIFVVEGSFGWTDFNPSTDFAGMTVTNYILNRARYLKIGNFSWVSIHLTATLAATLASTITITLPVTAGISGSITPAQGGACTIKNAGAEETGGWRIQSTSNQIVVSRKPVANFGAGNVEVLLNSVIEVL